MLYAFQNNKLTQRRKMFVCGNVWYGSSTQISKNKNEHKNGDLDQEHKNDHFLREIEKKIKNEGIEIYF